MFAPTGNRESLSQITRPIELFRNKNSYLFLDNQNMKFRFKRDLNLKNYIAIPPKFSKNSVISEFFLVGFSMFKWIQPEHMFYENNEPHEENNKIGSLHQGQKEELYGVILIYFNQALAQAQPPLREHASIVKV